MKPMVSKKGSQQVVVLGGNGCVTISATDRKKHVSNSVTVFDELLPGLIARLSAIAASRLTLPAPDGGDSAPSQTLSTPDMFSAIEHESTPAHTQVTQTVGQIGANNGNM